MISKELYKFSENETDNFFTSADRAEDYDGDTYEPITLSRTAFESKNELTRANIDITFDINDTFARRFLKYYADFVVSVTIFEKSDSGTIVVFKGRLVSVKPSEKSIVLKFENFFTSLRRQGLRGKYQKTCRHSLYDRCL